MKIGTACAIFLQINSEKYTDEEKGTAILEVLKMPPPVFQNPPCWRLSAIF